MAAATPPDAREACRMSVAATAWQAASGAAAGRCLARRARQLRRAAAGGRQNAAAAAQDALPTLYRAGPADFGTMTFGWSQASSEVDSGAASAMLRSFLAGGGGGHRAHLLGGGHREDPGRRAPRARGCGRRLPPRDQGAPLAARGPLRGGHPRAAAGLDSMDALGVEKVDVLYLHQPDPEHDLSESLSCVHELILEGKVKQLGMSNYRALEVERACELCRRRGWTAPSFYQGLYNPLNRLVEEELLPVLRTGEHSCCTATRGMGDVGNAAGYIGCKACGYKWNWSSKVECFKCKAKLRPAVGVPPPPSGVWAQNGPHSAGWPRSGRLWKKWAPWRHSTYASTKAGWDSVEVQKGDGGQSDPISTASLITSLAAYQGVGEKGDPTITAALDLLRRKAQEEEANAKPAPAPPKQRTGAQLLADANRALKELDIRIEKQRTKLTGAQLYLDDQLEKMDKLAQQRVEVQQRHLTALQQANQESGIIVVKPDEKTLNVKFECDGSLFEGLEECDIPTEEMDSIMQWKSELEQFQKEQLGTLQAKFKYIEEIHQKAKKAMQAPKKKRKVEAGTEGATAINPEDEKKKIRDANQAALEQLMRKLTVWLSVLSSLGFSEAHSTQQQSEESQVLFGNITEWGPQVQNYVQGPAVQQFDCLAFVETHKGPNQVSAMKTFLQKEGWKATITPAVPSGKSKKGWSAGELVATRAHIQSTSLEHWKGKHDKQGDTAFVGFSPMVLHLSIGNFIIIAAYLLPTLRFTGRNRKVMAALTAFVRLLKDPWLVVADWNCVPTELLASGWLEQMRGEIAYRDRPLLAQKLANSYGRWIEAVEEAVLQHSEVPQHQRDGYRGRAQGFGIKWTKSTAAPGRPHLYNSEAEWWAITHTQVIAINGLVKNNKDPQQLQQRGQEFRQRMQQVHVVSKHSDIELLNQWQQSAHDIFSPARQEREDVIEITERLAGQAARRALADGTKGFIRWAQDMWKKTPGALHRWTKDAQQPRLEEMISGKIVADPILIMNHKSESWAKKWTAAPHRQTALAGALRRCRLSAAQEDLPQLTIQDLNAATHRMGVKKARGIDAIGPLDIERLPDQAKYGFLDIIAQAEEHLMWPPQLEEIES
ncbi:unnamed protein product [Prorocentrum cordatum]|uniref:NADP-dependent oxidoreductase domain-containing protein n=1 Tax=Prorocentrum cordatum TaxID=2364126 RepID=A0ABN9T529_9DINO|nr:unnamed protein product [Polarella glacialis]